MRDRISQPCFVLIPDTKSIANENFEICQPRCFLSLVTIQNQHQGETKDSEYTVQGKGECRLSNPFHMVTFK